MYICFREDSADQALIFTILLFRILGRVLCNENIGNNNLLKQNKVKIIDEIKEIDFRLYVNKYLRENEWIIRKTIEDNKMLEDINGSSIL